MAIYRRQLVTLRQTTVEETRVFVHVPLFATPDERLALAIAATGTDQIFEPWRTTDFRTEVCDFHTIDQVEVEDND